MPSSRSKIAAAAVGTAAIAAGPTVLAAATYTVRHGDTLSDIARRHNTTVSALVQANGLGDANHIRIGQLLTLPDTAAGQPGYTAAATDSEKYAVRPGESLLVVAHHFGIDAATLARANGLGVHTALKAGQTLTVPGRLSRANGLLTSVAHQVGVDPRLLRAVAWMESGWQQGAVSPTGAVGIMQIEPYTGDWVSSYLAGRTLDISNAHDNVYAGALLLKHLLTVHGGDAAAALAAYYQGDGSIERNGLFSDTRQYQKVVSTLMHRE